MVSPGPISIFPHNVAQEVKFGKYPNLLTSYYTSSGLKTDLKGCCEHEDVLCTNKDCHKMLIYDVEHTLN
jgi:hypothetical protein